MKKSHLLALICSLSLSLGASKGQGQDGKQDACCQAKETETAKTASPLESKQETKKDLKEKALAAYEKFQTLDKNSNTALLDLYSEDAVIYSGVERERGGVIFEKFKKKDFQTEVERAVKDKHLVELNKETEYSKAHVKESRHELHEQIVELTFKAKSRDSGVRLHWLLRPRAGSQDLEIFDEHSVVYALKPRPLKHPHTSI